MWALENIFINIVYIQTFGEWLCAKPFSPEVLSAHFDNLKSHSHQKKTKNTNIHIFLAALKVEVLIVLLAMYKQQNSLIISETKSEQLLKCLGNSSDLILGFGI